MRTPYLANQAQHQPHDVGTGLGYSARLMLGVLAPGTGDAQRSQPVSSASPKSLGTS